MFLVDYCHGSDNKLRLVCTLWDDHVLLVIGYEIQSEYIEHVSEQCSVLIRLWKYYMVVGHKYFSCNAYTRIPRPEITMGSRVIRRILWRMPNVACNEWQVWVWLGMPWIKLRNMNEVKELPLSRREKISTDIWLVRPSSVWSHPNEMISVVICLTKSGSLLDQGKMI